MREYGMLSLLLIVSIGLSNGSKASANDGAKIESVRSKRSDAENRWRGPKYKSQYWGTEMAFQTLGGLASYRQREMYKEDPSDEPTVCFNSLRPRNGYFAYFICPERFQSDGYVYCCGDDGEENCCTFWGDGGRVAGVVIGILLFVGLVVVGVVLLCKFKLWPKWKKRNVEEERKHHNPTLDTVDPDNSSSTERPNKYGVPLTSGSHNDYGDYPALRRDTEMQPVYKGHPSDAYRYPIDRRSDTSEPHDYDIEPKRYHSEPYGHRTSSKRSYDSEPRGGHYSENSSRRSGSRRSDKESDLDTKHSFREDKLPPDDYEPVRHGHGSRYSDFDTLGSPVAKHPPGLPPQNTAV